MTAPQGASAPRPPGRLGEAVDPSLLQAYLADLDTWLRERRRELDHLDTHALDGGRADEVTADMSLAMASWQAVHDRHRLVAATFDGGRVDVADRERISALLWGRLDGAAGDVPGGLGTSLHEACRLNDALTGQLRARLEVDPRTVAATARFRDLRAQLARIEDQVGLAPEDTLDREVERLAGLMARLRHVEERARRGADVGGLLGPLELEATTYERDLIVGHAQRRDARDRAAVAREMRRDLERRTAALQELADRCVATVDPAPHWAVPDVAALSPVPTDLAAVASHLERLDRVAEAVAWAEERYAAALAEHDDLTADLDALAERARAAGLIEDPDLVDAEQSARGVLERRPTPMVVARQLVATYRAWLAHHGGAGAGDGGPA